MFPFHPLDEVPPLIGLRCYTPSTTNREITYDLCRVGGRIEKGRDHELDELPRVLVQIGNGRFVYFVDYRRTVLNPRTVSHAPYFPCFRLESTRSPY